MGWVVVEPKNWEGGTVTKRFPVMWVMVLRPRNFSSNEEKMWSGRWSLCFEMAGVYKAVRSLSSTGLDTGMGGLYRVIMCSWMGNCGRDILKRGSVGGQTKLERQNCWCVDVVLVVVPASRSCCRWGKGLSGITRQGLVMLMVAYLAGYRTEETCKSGEGTTARTRKGRSRGREEEIEINELIKPSYHWIVGQPGNQRRRLVKSRLEAKSGSGMRSYETDSSWW